jgi:hypothetical protein
MEATFKNFYTDQGRLGSFVKRSQQLCYLFFTQDLRQNISSATSLPDTPVPEAFGKSLNALAFRHFCRKCYRAQQDEDERPHRKYTSPDRKHQFGAQNRPMMVPLAEIPFPTAGKAGNIAPFSRRASPFAVRGRYIEHMRSLNG